jgi:hypothetical protein
MGAVNMRVSRVCGAALAAVALALGGCDAVERITGSDPPKPVDESPRLAKEKVEAYLAAMTAKDRVAGKQHLCPSLHGVFDKTSTGANGDFNKALTVADATVVDVRADGPAQKVTANLTLTAGERSAPVGIVFTVSRITEGWCIAGEEAAAPLPVTPAPSPS